MCRGSTLLCLPQVPGAVLQEPGQLCARHGFRQEKSLHLVTAQLGQQAPETPEVIVTLWMLVLAPTCGYSLK